MISRRLLFFFILIAVVLGCLGAAEFNDGNIRLVVHEKNGRFSLFYLTDPSEQRYEAFFNSKDPLTSFLAVSVNNRFYRLGESWSFRTKVEKQGVHPVITYESSFLQVTQVFSFIKTASSQVTNGIRINVDVKNKAGHQASVGMRMLIDTHLGEGREKVPFITDKQAITTETIVQGSSGEQYWISRSEHLSLMGSIVNPGAESVRNPDFLHFANWKKLNDVPWRAPYSPGRLFNNIPYSIGDSAVCYYYDPGDLPPGHSFKFLIYLAAEDAAGFIKPQLPAVQHDRDADMEALRKLLDRLDLFIEGKINLSEKELAEIDQSITILKKRYGLQ